MSLLEIACLCVCWGIASPWCFPGEVEAKCGFSRLDFVNARPFLDPRPQILRPLTACSALRAPKSGPSLNFHRTHAVLPCAAGVFDHTRHTPTSEPPCTQPLASPRHSGFHLKKKPESGLKSTSLEVLDPNRTRTRKVAPRSFHFQGRPQVLPLLRRLHGEPAASPCGFHSIRNSS